MSKLNLAEYQQLAKRTCPDLGSRALNMEHMEDGIFTECGEIVDIFKKKLAYKKPIDFVNLGEEIADVAWYLVNAATFNELKVEEALSFKVVDEGQCKNIFKWLYADYVNEEYTITDLLAILKSVCIYFKLDFEECLYRNIEKLKVRFPEKFSEEAALNRNLDAERKELEK